MRYILEEHAKINPNSLLLIILMSDEIFTRATVKEAIDILRAGYVVEPKYQVYDTIYRAVKLTGGMYSRAEIENLVNKTYIKTNAEGKVWIPDVLFYSFLREKQQILVKSGIIPEQKPDRRNYESLTEQQAEQLFITFAEFIKGLDKKTRHKLLLD